MWVEIVKFIASNWGAILSLGRTIRRGIIRIARKEKLVPGFRVEDEVVVLDGVTGPARDLVGLIGVVSRSQVPGHLAVTVVHNAKQPREHVQTEAIKPEFLQRIIRKS